MVLVDAFFIPFLLDSIVSGLSGLFSIVIIALFPVIAASLFLDWRAAHTPSSPQSRLPPGIQSASGEPVRQTRPAPTVRRDKRAARLETIVVAPQTSSGATAGGRSASSSVASHQFAASDKSLPAGEEADSKVKAQLDAIEQQMARLEGELQETGVGASANQSQSESHTDEELAGTGLSRRPRRELGEEEVTSELQAVDELLARLEEKRAGGGVDDSTYERLRSKYIKRKSELKTGN